MRDDPGIDRTLIARAVQIHYGITISSIDYFPVGHDLSAFVYKVIAADGTEWFLRVRNGPVHEPVLDVPRILSERGIPNILAPVRTCASQLWFSLKERGSLTAVLYPFIWGENAMRRGMTEVQWRDFGATLRAVHDCGIEDMFREVLRVDDFTLPSAALVRRVSASIETGIVVESEAAWRFGAFWRDHLGRIDTLLTRAENLGRSLQGRRLDMGLCHADIHAANILLGDDGRIWLVDWDGPMIAPRERDLFFVIGSRIAREVVPEEEGWFFSGYGDVRIDQDALVYFRYERIIEDIGEFGWSVMFSPDRSEAMRAYESRLAMGLFAPGADIDRAETVIHHW